MTPKEKAQELIDKFKGYADDSTSSCIDNAKYIALFCVDELIKYLPSSNGNHPNLQENEYNSEWWEEVKQEIRAI